MLYILRGGILRPAAGSGYRLLLKENSPLNNRSSTVSPNTIIIVSIGITPQESAIVYRTLTVNIIYHSMARFECLLISVVLKGYHAVQSTTIIFNNFKTY